MSKYETGKILICVKNDYRKKELTIGKKYNLINNDLYYIDIINDLNNYKLYPCSYFITIDEYEILHRRDKINKLL